MKIQMISWKLFNKIFLKNKYLNYTYPVDILYVDKFYDYIYKYKISNGDHIRYMIIDYDLFPIPLLMSYEPGSGVINFSYFSKVPSWTFRKLFDNFSFEEVPFISSVSYRIEELSLSKEGIDGNLYLSNKLYNKFTELINNSVDKFLEVVLDVYFTENLGEGIYKSVRLEIDMFDNLTITNNGQVEVNTVIDKEYPRQFNYIAFLDKLSEYMEKNEVIYSPF